MELQLINSISDNAIGNFGDFILGKVQRTIENPLSLILDPPAYNESPSLLFGVPRLIG